MVEHTGTMEVQERQRFLLGKKGAMRNGEDSQYDRRHSPGTLEKQVEQEHLGFVLSVLFTVGKYMSFFLNWSESPLMTCGSPQYSFC